MEITRQQAVDLINNYCIDEPENEQTAIDAIMSITADQLTENNGGQWIQIAGNLGMEQDKLDAIIYDQ